MKIRELRTTIVAVPQLREYRSSWRRKGHGTSAQCSVLVEVLTDDGITGIGESPVVFAGNPDVTVALLKGVESLILDRDPFEHDVLRHEIYAETGMAHLGTQGLSWALAGLDMAMWDIVGKVCGQPLHRVWGSAWRTESNFYADIPPADPAQMADEAVDWVERGFRTLYFKVGFEPEMDIARLAAVRSAVGDEPRIRVDANQAWSPGAAKRIISRMSEYDLEYVEQPVLASNLEDMAALRQSVSVPILAHEASLSVEGSLNVIKHQAADALQLDPRFDSGFSGARLAAGLAEIAGLPVVTHTFGELGVGTAAVLQLHAAHRNFILDNQTYYWNLSDDIIKGGLMPFNGSALQVPDRPGLGVELDPERVKHYAAYYDREIAPQQPLVGPAPTEAHYERRYILRPRE
jgi:L-alanine-DL-glutamate epimerase-like enolase superfamily enzyme